MVKIPEIMNKYCPNCGKHQSMKVKQEKSARRKGGFSAMSRREKRKRRGYGNKGRFSKRPVTQTKMASKTSKKVDLRLTCPECSKKWVLSYPRTKRVEFVK
ncbi:MAG: 50S ribosomal protein L44e [Asgard group archaeon]|nr:50S ribosomal protein L44e [Asgard group archaeon]